MRAALAAPALVLAFLGGASQAQETSYEASPGLIPIGGIFLFYHVKAPLSFEAMTFKNIPPGAVPIGEVQGHSCQRGFAIPLTASFRPTTVTGAEGDGSYKKTLERIRKAHPDLAGIYDVKVDMHTLSILGLFRMTCTEVLARGFKQGPITGGRGRIRTGE